MFLSFKLGPLFLSFEPINYLSFKLVVSSLTMKVLSSDNCAPVGTTSQL
jgi:hypothetical protein